MPVNVALPYGLNLGVAGILPYLPLPSKLATAVLPSMRTFEDESAPAFATRVTAAMQKRLNGLLPT